MYMYIQVQAVLEIEANDNEITVHDIIIQTEHKRNVNGSSNVYQNFKSPQETEEIAELGPTLPATDKLT